MEVKHAVTVGSEKWDGSKLTLAQLEVALPAKFLKELEVHVKPLAPGYTLPPRQDLRRHWTKCEVAMKALGPEICPAYLRNQHLERLAPHLLGEAVWEVIAPAEPASWSHV